MNIYKSKGFLELEINEHFMYIYAVLFGIRQMLQ